MWNTLHKKTRNAYQVFYPLAALFAAISVPLWIAQYVGFYDFGLSAQDHAHEMIFGFALAVMTGFLLNGVSRLNLLLLTLLWIMGRTLPLFNDAPVYLTSLTHIAFPVGLAATAAVPLFKNAKSWRNLAFAPILSAFIVAEVLFQSGKLDFWALGEERGLLLALNLLCAMIYMMGGRVVTAVTNGAMQAFDNHLKPGAQSYWEEKGFFALLGLALGDLFAFAPLSILAGTALSLALVMRLYHWQVIRVAQNPQCLWLHIGFAWLLVGIVLRTLGHFFGDPFHILGIHAITIAALGTLTLTIMSRTTQQRLRQNIGIFPTLLLSLFFLNASLIARTLMVFADQSFWAMVSASLFTIAFSLFFFWLLLKINLNNHLKLKS